MPQYTFKFDMPNKRVRVTATPTANTSFGYYAYELVSPAGVLFKSVPSTFFTNYITQCDVTYASNVLTSGSVDFDIALPLDINGVPLHGTYKFRAFHREELTTGFSNVNSFSETQRTVNVAKISPSVSFAADYNNNDITILDNTDYLSSSLIRNITALSLTNNSVQTSSTDSLIASPIDTYRVTLSTTATKTTVITVNYTSVVEQSVLAVILIDNAFFYNLSENIVKAKVILDGLIEASCKANRALSGAEQATYNAIVSKLSIIGAAMHFPYSMPTAVDAMKELDKLVN